jgi:endo-1,4-beta-xylanase
MKKHNKVRQFCAYQKSLRFYFKKHQSAVAVLLISMIGFMPIHAFAQLAASKSKFVGNVISNGLVIRSDFKKYWNQVTAENAGKWGSIESSPGVYNWTQLDNIYNYALTNRFPYKHHTLIWGQQQPSFMSSLDSAQQYQEIENWMMNSGGRYLSAAFCDVVNEPLHAPPAYKKALGGDGATGWDWVIKSFQLARQYWPFTKLHINEYSVINDISANARYLQIIKLLKDRGLIDGIGVQGHYFEVDGGAAVATLQSNLDNLAATGLPIYITELDINQQDDNTQLQRYQTIFPVLYEHPGVKGITLWGYAQGETWRPYTHLVVSSLAERPAMQWLRTYLASPLRPVLISPNGTSDELRNPLLKWRASESATSYRIQVSTNRVFSTAVLDSTVADTLLQATPLAANTTYYWRVSASNQQGTSAYSTTASFTTGQTTAVDKFEGTPTTFALHQNYPNPFNPVTSVSYSVGRHQHVSIKVYNIAGREVATLVDESKPAGQYRLTFDAGNLAGGVYFIRLSAGEFVDMKKAVLVR